MRKTVCLAMSIIIHIDIKDNLVENMSKEDFDHYVNTHGHCSAIVKVADDFSQIFMSHSSWYTYIAMTRIMKHYNFQTTFGVSKKISFSSYPAYLESLDDFYIMGMGNMFQITMFI